MRRPSPALVLATVAVVLASAGGAVAGSMITGAKIKDGTITGKDVKNGSLASGDLSGKARRDLAGEPGEPGANGSDGASGADGLRGPTGPTGPAGSPGSAGAPGTPGTAGPTGPTGPVGSTGLTGPSNAYASYRDQAFTLTTNNQYQTVLELPLPQAGSYVISGKAQLRNISNASSSSNPSVGEDLVTCGVFAAGNYDLGVYGTNNDSFPETREVVYLTVVANVTGPATAQLQCAREDDPIEVTLRKLTAIRVGSLSNTAATGP